MLKDKFKKTAQDEKIIDKNDFWLLRDNPMTKIGVFPYLGRQISPELEPDKVYQVLRPREELTRSETLESLKLIPLVNDHTMLGNKAGFTPAEEKGVHGTTGTNVQIKDDLITNDLKVFSEELKNLIENGKKDLSMGYSCKYDLTPGEYQGEPYDAIQRDILYNHIALVDEGRMGKDVCVQDRNITFDTLSEILKKKETKMSEEKQTQDVDKRELIREVMAIAAKPDSDFEGGEEEKIETIAKKLEDMSYNPSESGANDEEEEEIKVKEKVEDEDPKKCGDDDIDKRKKIEEVGKYLREKGLSNEDIQYVLKEMFENAYNNSENGASDEGEEKSEEEKPVSMDSAIKYLAKKESLINRLKPFIGENKKFGSMNIPQVVKSACDSLNIPNSYDGLVGYLTAKEREPKITVSLDSAFKQQSQSSVLKQYKSGK